MGLYLEFEIWNLVETITLRSQRFRLNHLSSCHLVDRLDLDHQRDRQRTPIIGVS